MTTSTAPTAPDFFQRIIAKIKSLWQKDAEPKLEQLYDDVAPEIKQFTADEIEQVGAVALTSIKTAAAAGKTPEDWLDVAYDAIKAFLPTIGKDASSTAISLFATLFQGHAKAQAVAEGTLVSTVAQENPGPVVANAPTSLTDEDKSA